MPLTSYYKLIDWWFLALFNILVLTLVFHTYLAFVIRKIDQEESFDEKKVEIGHRMITVQPVKSSSSSFSSYSKEDDDNKKKKLKKYVRRLNTMAKVIFVVFLVLFNIGFWMIAVTEHLKPAEEYMT